MAALRGSSGGAGSAAVQALASALAGAAGGSGSPTDKAWVLRRAMDAFLAAPPPPRLPAAASAAAPAAGGGSGATPIAVGQRVRVRDGVAKPTHGWGLVRPGMIGRVSSLAGDGKLRVDFEGQTGWLGEASEMVVVGGAAPGGGGGGGGGPAPTAIGQRVRVREGVVPSHDWGGARPGMVGRVVSLSAGGQLRVDFPSQASWVGEVHEMEVVVGGGEGAGQPAPPPPRPAVGASVRLAPSATSLAGCLGRHADRRTGVLVTDDGSSVPFKVACGGFETWYREGEVEAAGSGSWGGGGGAGAGAGAGAARLAVGATVAPTAAAPAGKCLGAAGSGREGVVLQDDHSDLPYQVRLVGGEGESWYAAEALALLREPAPLGFDVHRGQWRDVRQKLYFSAPGDAGRAITVYCNTAGAAGEGPRCAHADEALVRLNHWSCCGALDRGAAVCKLAHAHALSPQDPSPGRRFCDRCGRTGVAGPWRGCRAGGCDYDECSACYAHRPAALRARDGGAGSGGARLALGTVVRAAAGAPAGLCLRARGSGVRGKVVVDDGGSSRPYKVQLLDGSDYVSGSALRPAPATRRLLAVSPHAPPPPLLLTNTLQDWYDEAQVERA